MNSETKPEEVTRSQAARVARKAKAQPKKCCRYFLAAQLAKERGEVIEGCRRSTEECLHFHGTPAELEVLLKSYTEKLENKSIEKMQRKKEKKARLSNLPYFVDIDIANVVLISSSAVDAQALAAAMADMETACVIGFDTETRPVFTREQAASSTGPHLVQFSTATKTYLFRTNESTWPYVKKIIESPQIMKVGFDLRGDQKMLATKHGIPKIVNLLDLALGKGKALFETALAKRSGCVAPRELVPAPITGKDVSDENDEATAGSPIHVRATLSIAAAMELLLRQNFRKDKRITMSNWQAPKLSKGQLLYAANDAYGALKVFEELVAQGVVPQESFVNLGANFCGEKSKKSLFYRSKKDLYGKKTQNESGPPQALL